MSFLVFMHEEGEKKVIKLSKNNCLSSATISCSDEIALYPDIDPSGSKIVYSFGNDTKSMGLKLYDIQSKETEVLLEPRANVLHPRFAKNGKEVVFSSNMHLDTANTGSKHAIFKISTDNNRMELVISDEGKEGKEYYFASAAQDSSFYVYQENDASKTRRIVLNHFVDGTIETIDEGMSPSLSKDQLKIAYTKNIDSNWDVWVYDRLSKSKTRMTKHPGNDFAPTFDNFGNLVFASNRVHDTFNLHKYEQGKVSALTSIERGTNYSPRISGIETFDQSYMSNIPGEPRSSFGSMYYKNKVYVVGGHQGEEHSYPPESFVGTLNIYDVETGIWTTGPDRPHKCHGFSIAAYDDYIYAFGGFAYSADHKPKWKSLDVVDRYNIKLKKWETMSSMPRKRSSNVVAQVGKTVYLIGGWDSTPKHENDTQGRFHDEIDVFDMQALSFETHSVKLPMKRRAFSCVVDESSNKIYLVGGISEGSSHFALLDNVTAFDYTCNTFSEVSRLNFPTFAPATGILSESLFVFGGLFKTGRYSYEYVPHIYELNLRSMEWRHIGRYLREAKGFSQVISFHGRLGVLGGHTYLAEADTPLATFETFSLKSFSSGFVTSY